jgi:hypothetical protein
VGSTRQAFRKIPKYPENTDKNPENSVPSVVLPASPFRDFLAFRGSKLFPPGLLSPRFTRSHRLFKIRVIQ